MEKFYYSIFDGVPGQGQVSLPLCQPSRYLRSNIFHCYSWKSSTTTYLTWRQVKGRSTFPFVSRPAICTVIFHCYSWKRSSSKYLTGCQADGQVSLTLRQPSRYLRSNIFHCYSWKSSTTTYLTGRQVKGRSTFPFVSRPAICAVIYSMAIHGKILLLQIWRGAWQMAGQPYPLSAVTPSAQ